MLLFDIALIVIIATMMAYLAKVFKQPLIVAYVLAGILIGPNVFGLITDTSEITILAELGVAFLLFTVGLEMDIQKLRSVGSVAMIGGTIQVIITFIIGFLVSQVFLFDYIVSVYIGLLIAFSSTMIVAKILVDRNEIKTLHGRIMLGILILQDILVIFALPLLENLYTVISYEMIGMVLVKGIGMFSIALVLNRFAFRRILDYAAENREILFFTAITTCFVFMGFAYSLGFSIAIGAFIGGIALANFPYNWEIFGEMHSLRDFFVVIFFTSLGMQLNLLVILNILPLFIIILLIILLIKPLILSLIYMILGYGGRVSSIIGLGLGQASEFTFIIAAQGYMLAHLSSELYSVIISVVVVSMIATPYFMMFRNNIYDFFARMKLPEMRRLSIPRHIQRLEKFPLKTLDKHIIVLGCDNTGRFIIDYLKTRKQQFIVAEHNPVTIKKLNKEGTYCIYGDVNNEDVLKRTGLYKAKLAIITVPDSGTSSFIIEKAKKLNPKIKIFARAYSKNEEKLLYDRGADFVVIPDILSAEKLIKKIHEFLK